VYGAMERKTALTNNYPLLASAKSGERPCQVKKLISVDCVHSLEPLLIYGLRVKSSGNGTPNGGYRVRVSADIGGVQRRFLRRLGDQSQTDCQRNNILQFVGEVLECELVDDQVLSPDEIRKDLRNRPRNDRPFAGRSEAFSPFGCFERWSTPRHLVGPLAPLR
jgi:hypothetical protein